ISALHGGAGAPPGADLGRIERRLRESTVVAPQRPEPAVGLLDHRAAREAAETASVLSSLSLRRRGHDRGVPRFRRSFAVPSGSVVGPEKSPAWAGLFGGRQKLDAVFEALRLRQGLELLERVVLDLADALAGDTERAPDL